LSDDERRLPLVRIGESRGRRSARSSSPRQESAALRRGKGLHQALLRRICSNRFLVYSTSQAWVPSERCLRRSAPRGRCPRPRPVFLEDLVILRRMVWSSAKTSSMFREMRRTRSSVDDVVDSFVAHLEAAHVRHLALDLLKREWSYPRRSRASRVAWFTAPRKRVFLEDGRHVHLGIRDPHRLYLDIAFRHQRCDDVAGDGGDDLG